MAVLARRISRFFGEEIWKPDLLRVRTARALVYKLARVATLAARGFLRDGCFNRASGLTFTTTLSLVPLLAFAFSVLKGFGVYRHLVRSVFEPLINEAFGPASGARSGLRQAVERVLAFVEATDVSGLGAIGFLTMLIGGISLLGSVESAFNQIWAVKRARSLVRKIADYVAILVITPLCLFGASGVFSALEGARAVIQRGLGRFVEMPLALGTLFGTVVGLTFLYLVMPNTRPRVRSAVAGGFFGGVAFVVILHLHVTLQIGVAGYSALYSGFAALPLFLVWTYASWCVVLFGAEVAAAHRSEAVQRWRTRGGRFDQKLIETLGMAAMVRIADAFVQGQQIWTTTSLAAELGLPEAMLEKILARLSDHGLVVVLDDERPRYLPARSPANISVTSVLEALRTAPGRRQEQIQDLRVRGVFDDIDRAVAVAAGSRSILDVAASENARDKSPR